MPGDARVQRFLMFYLPVVFVAAALTMTTVNPLAAPLMRVKLLGLLPLVGFIILFAGSLIGGLVIFMLDEQEFGKRFAAGGLVATLVFSIAISNLLREPIIQSIGHKRGKKIAAGVAHRQQGYERRDYQRLRDGGYLTYFLNTEKDQDTLRAAFFGGYNGQFMGRYSQLVDTDALRQMGYEAGYVYGAALMRNAAYRGGAGAIEPLDSQLLERLEESELPAYIEGYRQGYDAGWQGR